MASSLSYKLMSSWAGKVLLLALCLLVSLTSGRAAGAEPVDVNLPSDMVYEDDDKADDSNASNTLNNDGYAAYGETRQDNDTVETPRKSFIQRLSAKRQDRQKRVVYDTAYIAHPHNRLTMKVRANLSGDGIHAKGTVNDIYSKANLHTRNKMTVSLAAIYKGVAVGLALNPAKLSGKNHDFEFNLNFYSTRLSLDLSYQKSKTLSGTIERNGEFHLEEGYADLNVLNVAAYYAFNYRRFSYPAAFTQSYMQRRSAGSWLAGLSFQGGTIKNSDEAPATLPKLEIKARHWGIGGGYGYNLVVKDKWLFHISALPTFVIFNYDKLVINGERKASQPMRLNLLLNERVAVVRNFSPKYFASLTFVMNNSLFDDENVVINQNKWRLRAALGIRF